MNLATDRVFSSQHDVDGNAPSRPHAGSSTVEMAAIREREDGVESNLCENDLRGEFALVGGTWRAIGLIAAQRKDSLHWIGNSQDGQIVAGSH